MSHFFMLDMQLDTLTSAPFKAFVGKTLTVEGAEGGLEVEVFSVNDNPLSAGPNSKRTPFCAVGGRTYRHRESLSRSVPDYFGSYDLTLG